MLYLGECLKPQISFPRSLQTDTGNSLLMCPPEHLHDQAGWDGSITSSRERLLSELSSTLCLEIRGFNNLMAGTNGRHRIYIAVSHDS